ncbi:MAG TPA: c-type cytochrome, partial [Isosphaeraceae bacterium]|nr:c-type cytochrome [Isosphaeraceae bacterium]
RIAAIEALGSIGTLQAQMVLGHVVNEAKGKTSSSPVAEAAVRTLPRVHVSGGQLLQLVTESEYPLGVRREALRALGRGQNVKRILELAEQGKLPPELKTEATTILYAHPDRALRDEVAKVLPPPKTASGRPLPPIFVLLRREGDPEHGREVFFRNGQNSCASCHRVQGRGQWVGPDLSTIGTKYGKDELLRSILNPGAAIGVSYQALIVAMADGRVITGLPVEETPEQLVLKTAEGQRINLRGSEIEDKKTSDVSLMPEGLAETMTDQDLVDVLAFLSGLKQPVSIVGQYQVAGPIESALAQKFAESAGRIDPSAPLAVAGAQPVSWRRVNANAESLIDLAALVGPETNRSALLYTPVTSPSEQQARLVVDTRALVRVWLNGREVPLSAPETGAARAAEVRLPQGRSDLLMLFAGGPEPTLVTTIVAAQSVEFSAPEASKVSAR